VNYIGLIIAFILVLGALNHDRLHWLEMDRLRGMNDDRLSFPELPEALTIGSTQPIGAAADGFGSGV
jgi:hypothetical protein